MFSKNQVASTVSECEIIMENKEKVIVIGLDGITFNLIKPWVKAGKLPAFARLMEEGAYGELKSTPDMMSPSAWTSFATGTNPGKHRIYNFMDLVPNTLQIRYLNSTHRASKAVWTLLNEYGKKTGVLGVPMTYPADKVDGFMTSGWTAPSITSKGYSHPPEFIDELVKMYGDYPLFPMVKKHVVEGRPLLGIESIRAGLEIHAKASKHLMKTREWDLLIAFFIATDQVQHYYWHYMDPQHPAHVRDSPAECRDAIYNVYERCDRIIADLTENFTNDATVIVMSDHGHGRNHGAVQYLPNWLTAMGFAVDKSVSGPSNPLTIPITWMKKSLAVGLKAVYNQMNKRLSMKMKGQLNKLLPGIRDKVESTWRFSAIDWSKTKVFFHYEPRINLKGREPFGIVSPGQEYEELRDLLIKKLYECTDPATGEKVVERVFKREEVYSGDHIGEGPDIVIWWKEGIVLSGLRCARPDGTVVTVTDKHIVDDRTGNHLPYGVMLARGKHIRKGVEVKGAELIDLAPTILHLMGAPVPDYMDGKVLTDVLTEAFLKDNPVKHTTLKNENGGGDGDYTESDGDKVKEHLKALGYME